MIRFNQNGTTLVKEYKNNLYCVKHWNIKKGLVSLGIPIPPIPAHDEDRPSYQRESRRIIEYPKGKRLVGWTIALPPNTIIQIKERIQRAYDVKVVTRRVKYIEASLRDQYHWLKTVYLPSVATTRFSQGLFIPELHKEKKGEGLRIHLHGICFDDGIQDRLDFDTTMKSVNTSALVQGIFRKRTKKPYHALNHMFMIKDIPAWIEYLSKDTELHEQPGIEMILFGKPYEVPDI